MKKFGTLLRRALARSHKRKYSSPNLRPEGQKLSSSSAVQNVTHPELVFGLVGPIGVDMDAVQSSLKDALSQVQYNSSIIHLSEVLKDYEDASLKHADTTHNSKISRANSFCARAENPAAMAAIAIVEIMKQRERETGSNLTPAVRHAYIIRQLKRSAEVALLRQTYGPKFIQISVSLGKEDRIRNLTTSISLREPSLTLAEAEKSARELVERDDHEIGVAYGQEVGEIFHHADFFISGKGRSKASSQLDYIIRAFFGDNSKSPRKDDLGAFFAASAALRSIDLSRQVGSAIFSSSGDIITIGCNEVPTAGGGNYWAEDENPQRDFERGAEQNNIEKQRIISNAIDRLKNYGLIPKDVDLKSEENKRRISQALDDALVSDITEYGRMTHAEMSAIMDAARLGRSLKGSTIYVTTFPCHNCAKHIVAAGISRVVFIEPYPKSRALESHSDSISMKSHEDSKKVSFEHFEGISPSRYSDIFRKHAKRRTGQKLNDWYENNEPRPMIFPRDNLHVRGEAVLAGKILSKLIQTHHSEASSVNVR